MFVEDGCVFDNEYSYQSVCDWHCRSHGTMVKTLTSRFFSQTVKNKVKSSLTKSFPVGWAVSSRVRGDEITLICTAG